MYHEGQISNFKTEDLGSHEISTEADFPGKITPTIQQDQEQAIRGVFNASIACHSKLAAYMIGHKRLYGLAVKIWDISAECETNQETLKVEYRFYMGKKLIGRYETTLGLMLQ